MSEQIKRETPASPKEYVDGYEIIERVEVGKRVLALGHDSNAQPPYCTCKGYKDKTNSYDWFHFFDNYEVAKAHLLDRIDYEKLLIERKMRIDSERGSTAELYTSEHCYPHDGLESVEGKVVAMCVDMYLPEYQYGDYQLIFVTDSSIHGIAEGIRLETGERVIVHQLDVIGEVKKLPNWAKTRLAEIQAKREQPTEIDLQDRATSEQQRKSNKRKRPHDRGAR